MSSSRQTRWSQERRAQGLCTSCGEPVQTFKSLCDSCMSKQRTRMRARRNSEETYQIIIEKRIPNPFKIRMQCPIMRNIASLPSAFLRFTKTTPSTSCVIWTGTVIQNRRYAQHKYGRYGNGAAHRFSYEFFNGPIPRNLELDHLCENKLCVNPDHLEPVTHQENVIRGFLRRELYGRSA